jgi:hypothetical protein
MKRILVIEDEPEMRRNILGITESTVKKAHAGNIRKTRR